MIIIDSGSREREKNNYEIHFSPLTKWRQSEKHLIIFFCLINRFSYVSKNYFISLK